MCGFCSGASWGAAHGRADRERGCAVPSGWPWAAERTSPDAARLRSVRFGTRQTLRPFPGVFSVTCGGTRRLSCDLRLLLRPRTSDPRLVSLAEGHSPLSSGPALPAGPTSRHGRSGSGRGECHVVDTLGSATGPCGLGRTAGCMRVALWCALGREHLPTLLGPSAGGRDTGARERHTLSFIRVLGGSLGVRGPLGDVGAVHT